MNTPLTVSPARDAALRQLAEIEIGGSYSNLLRHGLSHLQGPDRGLAVEMVGGVTRRRNTLDWYLAKLLTKPIETLPLVIRNDLRLGAYQLLFLDRVPASAAVDEAVKLAHFHGHPALAKVVNGVLRTLDRRKTEFKLPIFADQPMASLMHTYSLPQWLAERWLEQFGDGAEALGAWSIAPPKLSLRTNTLRTTREALLEALGDRAKPSHVVSEGITLTAAGDPAALPGYAEGHFYIQDEAAMLVARVVDPQPGEIIIDVGAAPGGKTTHLAALMQNQGEVYAVERAGVRLKLLAENVERLGTTIVKAVEADAADLSALPMADRILLDVPCSGLGVLPRKPDLRWRQSVKSINELATLQGRLLDGAAERLKPGGVMVYSTCTIGRAENQDVIHAFLDRHPEFTLDALAPWLPEAWRTDVEEEGLIQLLPYRHDVDGFFIARLRRGIITS